jgi:hypothetical protein
VRWKRSATCRRHDPSSPTLIAFQSDPLTRLTRSEINAAVQ